MAENCSLPLSGPCFLLEVHPENITSGCLRCSSQATTHFRLPEKTFVPESTRKTRATFILNFLKTVCQVIYKPKTSTICLIKETTTGGANKL